MLCFGQSLWIISFEFILGVETTHKINREVDPTRTALWSKFGVLVYQIRLINQGKSQRGIAKICSLVLALRKYPSIHVRNFRHALLYRRPFSEGLLRNSAIRYVTSKRNAFIDHGSGHRCPIMAYLSLAFRSLQA